MENKELENKNIENNSIDIKKEDKEIIKKQRRKVIIVSVIVLAIMAFLCVIVGKPLLEYVAEPDKFRQWVDDQGIWGRIVFCAMVIVQVILAFIPGEPFEIAAGYAFGVVEGTILCILASGLGSMLVFMIVRKFGRGAVELFFPKEKIDSLKFLKDSAKREMLYLIIFIIPGTPKDLLSYVAGLTDVKVLTWVFICSVGRLPSIITSTVGGDALGSQNYLFAVGVFVVTMAISGLGILLYNKILKKHGKNNPN